MKFLTNQLIFRNLIIRRCSSASINQQSPPSSTKSLKLNDELILKEDEPNEIDKYRPQRLPPLLSITDLLKLYKVRSTKHLSQNFLINPRLTKNFVDLSGVYAGCSVLEIGPGPGSLTRRILEKSPRELIVLEKDRRFLPILEMLSEACEPGQMKIMLGDCLDYTFANLFPEECKKEWNQASNVYLISNLPFNVSTQFLIKMLNQCYVKTGLFSYGRVKMTLGFQLEVAKRITAPVLSPFRSRLSVMSQLFTKPKLRKKIKGKSYVPKPDVDTAVVKLVPLKEPLIKDVPFDVIEKFIRILFHLRNAYSSKSLKFLFPAKKQNLTFELFKRANLDPIITPYMLGNEEIANMITIYWEICKEHPELLEHDFRQVKGEPKLIKAMFYELGGSQRLIDEAIRKEFFLDENVNLDQLRIQPNKN